MNPGQMARVLRPLWQAVRMVVARAVVHVVHEDLKMQELQLSLLEGEVKDGVEHYQPYGSFHVPLAGAEALAVFVQADRSLCIVPVVSDRRYRPRGQPAGDVGLNTEQDDPAASAVDALHRFQLTRDRKAVMRADEVDIKCGGSTLVFNAAGLTVVTPKVVIESPDISLGGEGGPKVARIGDLVNVASGSSAGQWPIVTGSEKVTAT